MTQRYSSSLSTKKILEEVIRNSKHASNPLAKYLYKEMQCYLIEEHEAKSLFIQLGTYVPERPKGIPKDWKIIILPNLTMRYVNPENHQEYVEILTVHPNPKLARVAYHHPDLVKQDIKDFPMSKVPSLYSI